MSLKKQPLCEPLMAPGAAPAAGHRLARLVIPTLEAEKEEEDWMTSFRRAVNAGPAPASSSLAQGLNEYRNKIVVAKIPEPTGVGDFDLCAGSTLNTPTVEYEVMPQCPLTSNDPLEVPAVPLLVETVPTEHNNSAGVVLMEMDVPVLEEPKFFQFPTTQWDIDSEWTLGGSSPEEDLQIHAPLSLVEGLSEGVKKIGSASLFSDYPTINAPVFPPAQQQLTGLSRNDEDDIKMAVDCIKEEEEEMVGKVVSNSLMTWIMNDNILSDSEFPVEAGEHDESLLAQPGYIAQPGVLAQTGVTATPSVPAQRSVVMLPQTLTINMVDYAPLLPSPAPDVTVPAVATTDSGISAPATKSSRPRGRPPVPLERPVAPPLPRASRKSAARRQSSQDSSSGELTEQEIAEWKYRRQRDLNNIASKKCRVNRKERQAAMEQELHHLAQRNMLLRRRLRVLEAKVHEAKQLITTQLVPGLGTADPAAIERLWE